MTTVPAIFGEGRAKDVAVVALSAICQAAAAGAAAFAMRDIFLALHGKADPIPVSALVVLFLAGAAVAGLRVLGRVVAERLGQDYAISLRRQLFRQLSRMPADMVANRRRGGLALRFVGDLTTARNWVGLGVARIIAATIVLPGAAAVLVALDPALAAAAAAPILISIAAMIAMAPRIQPLHKRLRSRRAGLAIEMMEKAPAAPALRLLGRDGRELENLARRGRDLRAAAVGRIAGAACLRSLPDLGTAAAAMALLWVAFVTDAAAASAAGALAVLGILVQPMRDLADVWDRRCAWRIARRKCETVLSSTTLEAAKGPPSSYRDGPPNVAFDNVGKGALAGLSGLVPPGATIAIVGPNGAGKSTCLALAAGLEQTTSGHVRIDGTDVHALPHAVRRQAVAYVGPHAPILKGSLRRALSIGLRPRPEDSAIEAAAQAFGLHDVLERLGGLDGKVAEDGRNLSSGEARRVQLVRTSLARPHLLLLDEPGDALDPAGRTALRRFLRDVAATTLHVTGDIDFVRRADAVWFLDDGVLAEAGAPEDLLRGNGPTARFFHIGQAA